MKKSVEEMIDGYVWTDSSEVPTLMHVHEMSSKLQGCFSALLAVRGRHIVTPPFLSRGPRVNADAVANADADAYVETLQTIVVKPPWIDSVANGGRPLHCVRVLRCLKHPH
ncbi:hypothetical protein ACTXT7_016956 [Hymenolepis weldensis]